MDDIPISSTNGPGPPGQPPPGQTPPSLAPLCQPKNEVTTDWVVVSCNKSESSSYYYEPHRQQQVQLDEFLSSNAPEELKFDDKFDGSQIDVNSEIRSSETALKLIDDFKQGIPVLSSVVKTLRSLLSWLGWRQYSASEEERGKFQQQFRAVGAELARLELQLRCCYQKLAEESVMRNKHLFGCDGFRIDFDSDLTYLVEKYLNRIGIPSYFFDLRSSKYLGLCVDSAFIEYIRRFTSVTDASTLFHLFATIRCRLRLGNIPKLSELLLQFQTSHTSHLLLMLLQQLIKQLNCDQRMSWATRLCCAQIFTVRSLGSRSRPW